MSIPGANLLLSALSVIARTSVTYYQATGRALNDVGQDVTTYALPVVKTGSLQAIPKNLYEQYGLDLQKKYYNFFTENNFVDIQRGVSNDLIVYAGNVYQCESATDWYGIDGWLEMLVCLSGLEVPNA